MSIMTREITIPSSVVALKSDAELTPAMTAAFWEIASALDKARVPATTENSVWLSIAAADLRGNEGRNDNFWLRRCLDRMTGIKIGGELKGEPWGAVIVSQWRFVAGGSVVEVLVTPAGVEAFRAPQTFSKIESRAAHSLTGHGRRLYTILADKKRLNRPFWTFDLAELRELMGVGDKKSYEVWGQFRKRVIDPALKQVNDFGTVNVSMTLVKRGRTVSGVTFRWNWRDLRDATDTAEQNERHSKARRKQQRADDAPPLIEGEPQADAAADWWGRLTDAEREAWADAVGRVFYVHGQALHRRTNDLRAFAHEQHQNGATPETAKRVE